MLKKTLAAKFAMVLVPAILLGACAENQEKMAAQTDAKISKVRSSSDRALERADEALKASNAVAKSVKDTQRSSSKAIQVSTEAAREAQKASRAAAAATAAAQKASRDAAAAAEAARLAVEKAEQIFQAGLRK